MRREDWPPYPCEECPNCGSKAWVGTRFPVLRDRGDDEGVDGANVLPEHTVIRCFSCSKEFLMLVAGEAHWRKLQFRTCEGRIVSDW